MSLYDRAKSDWQNITTNTNGWGAAITMVAPDESVANVVGLRSKHHIGIDPETGNWINTKNAHVSVSEKQLTDQSYPVRDASGEVNLDNHRVTVKDSTGADKEFVIREFFPNETIGVIVCILGEFE